MSDYDPNYIPQKNYFLIGVKCIVFNPEGKLLLLQRSSKAGGGGKWSLIGGGLDHNEDPLEGIKREVREEAEIEIYDIKPINIITFKDDKDFVLMIAYQAKTDSDKITLNWEHDDYKWISKEEALNMEISETIKDFIKSTN